MCPNQLGIELVTFRFMNDTQPTEPNQSGPIFFNPSFIVDKVLFIYYTKSKEKIILVPKLLFASKKLRGFGQLSFSFLVYKILIIVKIK